MAAKCYCEYCNRDWSPKWREKCQLNRLASERVEGPETILQISGGWWKYQESTRRMCTSVSSTTARPLTASTTTHCGSVWEAWGYWNTSLCWWRTCMRDKRPLSAHHMGTLSGLVSAKQSDRDASYPHTSSTSMLRKSCAKLNWMKMAWESELVD